MIRARVNIALSGKGRLYWKSRNLKFESAKLGTLLVIWAWRSDYAEIGHISICVAESNHGILDAYVDCWSMLSLQSHDVPGLMNSVTRIIAKKDTKRMPKRPFCRSLKWHILSNDHYIFWCADQLWRHWLVLFWACVFYWFKRRSCTVNSVQIWILQWVFCAKNTAGGYRMRWKAYSCRSGIGYQPVRFKERFPGENMPPQLRNARGHRRGAQRGRALKQFAVQHEAFAELRKEHKLVSPTWNKIQPSVGHGEYQTPVCHSHRDRDRPNRHEKRSWNGIVLATFSASIVTSFNTAKPRIATRDVTPISDSQRTKWFQRTRRQSPVSTVWHFWKSSWLQAKKYCSHHMARYTWKTQSTLPCW